MAVIVQSADQAFGAGPFYAGRIEPAGHLREERQRLVGQKGIDLRRIGDEQAVARILAVEDPQRVLLEAFLRILAQLAFHAAEMRYQRGAPGVAAVGIAQRVELQRDARDPQFPQQLIGHRQQLDIGLRLARADDLGVDLVELAVAALLRAFVAEQRAVGGELERGVLLPAVGEVGARDPGGEFGPQGERIAAAILERIHFLGDDIGGLADRAGEHLGLFEHRHLGAAEAVELADPLEGLDHEGKGFGIGAEDVLRATDRLRGAGG